MDDDASKPVATKRRRPESPTRDKVPTDRQTSCQSCTETDGDAQEREIDKNRINKRDMWTYACMQQAPATKVCPFFVMSCR